MSRWTAPAHANATPEQLLEVLTHPEEIRRWSPVKFDADGLAGLEDLGGGDHAQRAAPLASRDHQGQP